MAKNGRRIVNDRDANGVSCWEKREKVLEPFAQLRGLQHIVITGSVSDEWAFYLKESMKSDEKAIMPTFHRPWYDYGVDGPSIYKWERLGYYDKHEFVKDYSTCT